MRKLYWNTAHIRFKFILFSLNALLNRVSRVSTVQLHLFDNLSQVSYINWSGKDNGISCSIKLEYAAFRWACRGPVLTWRWLCPASRSGGLALFSATRSSPPTLATPTCPSTRVVSRRSGTRRSCSGKWQIKQFYGSLNFLTISFELLEL